MEITASVNPHDPLGQGDIIRWHGPRSRLPCEMLGIIVNADCDIYHDKVAEQLTYVPVLTVQEYASRVWFPERMRRLAQRQSKSIAATINKWHKKTNKNAIILSHDNVIQICLDQNINDFISWLDIDNERNEISLKNKMQNMINIVKSMASPPDESLIDLYCEYGAVCDGGKLESIMEASKRQLAEHLQDQDQLDSFFISSLPKMEFFGHVAALRLFRTIPTGYVCTSQSEWYRHTDYAFRIGRLIPELRYALVQRFSNLFLRLGLPARYEKHRDEILEDIELSTSAKSEKGSV